MPIGWVRCLDGVDLEAYPAEILGLVGARIRGNVRYKGQDLLTLDEKCLTQMRDRDIAMILSTINTLQLERR